MVFLEPETPERNWTFIYEISLVQGLPSGGSSCGYPSWVALIYCPVTLGNFGWGPMGDGSQTVHEREWGQGLAKHHLELGQWSSFPALSPRVDTIW